MAEHGAPHARPRPPPRGAERTARVLVALVAAVVVLVALALVGPLGDLLGAWRERPGVMVVLFFAHAGALLALLGALLRQPALAWPGAAVFHLASLLVGRDAWGFALLGVLLLLAVALWQGSLPRPPRPAGPPPPHLPPPPPWWPPGPWPPRQAHGWNVPTGPSAHGPQAHGGNAPSY